MFVLGNLDLLLEGRTPLFQFVELPQQLKHFFFLPFPRSTTDKAIEAKRIHPN
jgi:hypothetical protein